MNFNYSIMGEKDGNFLHQCDKRIFSFQLYAQLNLLPDGLWRPEDEPPIFSRPHSQKMASDDIC